MKTLRFLFLQLCFLSSILSMEQTVSWTNNRRLDVEIGSTNTPSSEKSNRCILYWEFMDSKGGDSKELACEIIIHGGSRRIYPLKGLSDQWIKENEQQIRSGITHLVASRLEVLDYKIHVRDTWGNAEETYIEQSDQQRDNNDDTYGSTKHNDQIRTLNDRRRRLDAKGTKETVVIRIEMNDGVSTPYNESELRNLVFGTTSDGTYDDSENLRSRMDQCSYGQLKIQPSTRTPVQNGVYSLKLDMDIDGAEQNKVVNTAIESLETTFENKLGELFDYVMICVPKGVVDPFIAYGFQYHWLSVYHDTWCGSVSAQVHEVGHNVGLAHSGKGTCDRYCDYADKSGMMGYTYPETDGPKMCYNGAKSWQLGWYQTKSVDVDPLTSAWRGRIVGISDYGTTSNDYKVIVRINDSTNNIAYYVAFNRKDGINDGTKDGADQVLVTSQRPIQSEASDLRAKLSSFQSYKINDFDQGESVTIMVNEISRSGIWYADITITSSKIAATPIPTAVAATSPPTTPFPSGIPTKSPTTPAPTPTPTRSPTRSPTQSPTTGSPTKSPTKTPSTNSPTPKPTYFQPLSEFNWEEEPLKAPPKVSPGPSDSPLLKPSISPIASTGSDPTEPPSQEFVFVLKPSISPIASTGSDPTEPPSQEFVFVLRTSSPTPSPTIVTSIPPPTIQIVGAPPPTIQVVGPPPTTLTSLPPTREENDTGTDNDSESIQGRKSNSSSMSVFEFPRVILVLSLGLSLAFLS